MRCTPLSWSSNKRALIRAGVASALAVVLARPAAAENNAVVIFDHSSSMWQTVNGTAKAVLARDMLKTLIEEQEGKLNLGILLFGAKKTSGCDDLDAIRPVGAIDSKAYSQALDGAKPKSNAAPVAASLGAAAGMFKAGSGPHSIILIVDGPDGCKGDPCAAARSLKQKTPEAIVHVIGFDAQAEERLQDMSCVAEATGGMFATAVNEDELELHLRRAFQLALAGTAAAPLGRQAGVAPGEVPPAIGEPPVFTSSEPGTLSLAAVMSGGGQPLVQGVVWRVFDARVQEDGSYRLISSHRDAKPSVTLRPGEYLINAAYGRANVTKRLTVWPGKAQEDTFNLNAGGLRLYATLAKQPLLQENSLLFDVFSEETDQFGNRRKVIANAKSGVVMRLNGGNYRVHSIYGDSNAVIEADVTIEPGKLTEATVDHQAGKVMLKLVLKPGGEAMADTVWNIYSSDGQLVKRSGGAFPSHVLAAGTYQLKVEHGGKEIAGTFAVEPGDKKQVEVVMP
jgi:hypothetical protein